VANLLKEQIEGGEFGEMPKTGQRTVRRYFKAPGVRDENTARTAFYNEGHEVYPGDTSLSLVSLAVSPLASGAGFDVTAEYASKQESSFSPPRDDPNYFHFGWGQQDVKVKLPFSLRTRVFINDNQPEGVEVWKLSEIEYTETRILRIFRARVRGLAVTAFDAIAREKRKIHTIYGREYLFMGGDVQEVDGESVDVTYTWQIDNGTPFASDNNRYRVDVEYPIVSTSPVELMRLPYTETIAVPPGDPRTEPFGAVPFYPYTRNNDGWQSLPGTNRL